MDLHDYVAQTILEYRAKAHSKYTVVSVIILDKFLLFLREHVYFPELITKMEFLKELTTAARESRIQIGKESRVNQDVVDNVLVEFINFMAWKQAEPYKISREELL